MEPTPVPDDAADESGNLEGPVGTKNYVKAVLAYSYRNQQNSLFPGSNYRHLAQFLNTPYSPLPSDRRLRLKEDYSFAVLHELGPDADASVTHFDAGLTGLAELTAHPKPATDCTQLLFLRGFPSPEWLGLVGSRYRVDPEYFRRHMDFGQTEDLFDLPGNPSSSKNIVQLPVYTIGANNAIKYQSKDFASNRQQAAESTKTQLRHLLHQGKIGESIVRRYFVHDERYVSMEQLMSVCVEKKGGGWVAVVWLDGGRDISALRNVLWDNKSTSHQSLQRWFLPVIQHRARSALSLLGVDRQALRPENSLLNTSSTSQSSTLLHNLYGQTLNQKLARVDAFYALSELFFFAAASECQMLNVLERQIANEDTPSAVNLQLSLGNLQYIRSILETHVNSISAILSCIECRGSPKWPRATEGASRDLVDITARDLKLDYEQLQRRAHALSSRCSSGMDLIMNRAMLAESQRAIDQASGVARLTLLAFLFIPLSFTTSIFGMNFRELNTDRGLSIWVWFCVAAPIFAASLVLCFWREIRDFSRRSVSLR